MVVVYVDWIFFLVQIFDLAVLSLNKNKTCLDLIAVCVLFLLKFFCKLMFT